MTVTQFDLSCQIIRLVCVRLQVTTKELEGPSRKPRCVLPRWIAITLIRRHTQLAPDQIALLFNRCRTAILHALAGLEREVQIDCATGRLVATLDAQVRSTVHSAIGDRPSAIPNLQPSTCTQQPIP